MKLITKNLVKELKSLSQEAVHISWITAFAMKSGVNLMLNDLKVAHDRGCQIQILVGDYLCITQPEALKLLHNELPNAEIRLYQSYGRSFHPKAYLFRQQNNQHLIVGSSNLSQSALTTGVEWSLQTVDLSTFEQAMDEFHHLFTNPNTIPVNFETIKLYEERFTAANDVKSLSKQWSSGEETSLMYGLTSSVSEVAEVVEKSLQKIIKPRPAQAIALEKLEETLAEGFDKALAIMATGLGKTYLSAFFADKFQRVLFVVHRDEILQQAKAAFETVYPHKTTGYFKATEKDMTSDFIFASVATLSQQFHLDKFSPTDFDLIVIDEFHHAAAASYRKVIDYFEPQFLLGITATPDRLDNQDVYGLCDGNVAVQIHFLDAIAKSWLSPFHYYGVKDEIDYSKVRWLGTHYDDEQLFSLQTTEPSLQKIYSEWLRLKQTRTIGFCSTIRQAEIVNTYFKVRGIKSYVLTGHSSPLERKSIREQLIQGEIDIIFTVDLFNEGVDIPTVDTLLFMRPTESIAVFTQQIGRGLRIAEGKEHCVIIDFIGNYRNADKKLAVFKPQLLEKGKFMMKKTEVLPDINSTLNFDVAVIDLLKELSKKNQTRKQQMINAYFDIKMDLGRRPTYLEYYLQSPFVDVQVAREFGSYFIMLLETNDVSSLEKEIIESHRDLLIEVEKTGMNKSYKMVVLHAMLARGESDWFKPITAEQVTPLFKNFLQKPSYQAIDKIDMRDSEIRKLIHTMPMSKWGGSSKGTVVYENHVFSFNINVHPLHESILYRFIQQIVEFRLSRYFSKKGEILPN